MTEIGRTFLKTALQRASSGTEGARLIGSQLTGIAGSTVQAMLEGLKTAVDSKLSSSDASVTNTRVPTDLSVTNAKVSATAAIDESKLALATDAAAGTGSRRTLGTGATQAPPGNDSRFTTAASETVAAHAELATQAETDTGTDDLRIVTPLKLAGRSFERTANKGAASGYTPLDSGLLVPVANIATGTPNGTKFLRDDRSWQTVPLPAAATESAAGIAEIATQGETDTGTDDARIVTPLKLAGRGFERTANKAAASGYASLDGSTKVPAAQIPAATETAVGGAELATQAETDTGTDDLRIVTPLKLAGRSFERTANKGAASGYAPLDSGLLVPVTNIGTGTPDGTKFLRDDRVWTTLTSTTPQATETVVGASELATTNEAFTGTDTQRIITPLTLSQNIELRMPLPSMDYFVNGYTAVSTGVSLIITIGRGIYATAGASYQYIAQNYTATANRDVYAWVSATGVVSFTEVANGAAQPSIGAGNNFLYKFVTNAAGVSATTDMRRTTPLPSETQPGITELATQAETDTGTDDLRITTPLKLHTKSWTRIKLSTSPTTPAAEAELAWNTSYKHLELHDGTRLKKISPLGFKPYAYPEGAGPGATVATAISLVAAGGSLVVPIVIDAPMILESITYRDNSVATARGPVEIAIFAPETGAAGTNVLNKIDSGTIAAFTPTVASNRTATLGAPQYLSPGVYWVAIKNNNAATALAPAGVAAGTMALNVAQTKTFTTAAYGSTLDLTAATWVKITTVPGIVLNGRVFAQAAIF